jgi:hypothetical protein
MMLELALQHQKRKKKTTGVTEFPAILVVCLKKLTDAEIRTHTTSNKGLVSVRGGQ